jgi:hypothetical protein
MVHHSRHSVLLALGLFFAASAASGLLVGGRSREDVRHPEPVAWWTFDEADGSAVLDRVSGIADTIRGHVWRRVGVSGGGLKFDDFTTQVVRPAAKAPRLASAFTVQAWIALAAYPWNWSPIVSQERQPREGYFFGVGPRGEIGLSLAVSGTWQSCVSPTRVPLRKWVHVAASYDEAAGGALFVDGVKVASLDVKGRMTPADSADLLMGMNPDKRMPKNVVGKGAGTLPAWFSLDAILDDVKIHDRALGPGEIQQAANAFHPGVPDIPPRVLPSGPPGPGRFGAYYVRLKYYDEWDALWPVGPYPDIVVQFDRSPVRVVFWRGTRYSPAWVTENNQWTTDQSVEGWNDEAGCFEHMQDPQCRYSHVRIIENTPARVVVHWRYAPVSSRNTLWKVDETTGWGLWVDEYYTFYPDGTGLRRVTWRKPFLDRNLSEIQETLPLAQVGQGPDQVFEHDVLKLANMKGETHTYSWPGPEIKRIEPEQANIQVVNLRSKADPFLIFEPGNHMVVFVNPRTRSDGETFVGYNHFPVSQIPSDGMRCVARDRVSHLGVNYNDPVWHESPDGTVSAVWMTGTTEGTPESLLPLARSWLQPAELKLDGDAFVGAGYDRAERAYVVRRRDGSSRTWLSGRLLASEQTPLANACLLVKNWGAEAAASVRVDGRPMTERDGARVGYLRSLEGTGLIVWLPIRGTRPVSVSVRAARRGSSK